MNDEKRLKEEIQQSKIRLSDENKAKLNELKLFKKVPYQILNGWTDLVYELGKNIEDLCKLANVELPQIEHIKSKYSSLRFDYYFTTPVPKIVETLIDSLIYEAEDKSERICEYCGADGSIDGKEDNSLILKSCDKCSKSNNLTSDKELLQALVKSKRNKDNWYADELLEVVTHIQEHAKNKVISKAEYVEMLYGVIRRANLIKEKMLEDEDLLVFNPKDFTDNCFYKQPNADKPSVKTVSNVIRKYLGSMNKQDIHTLCEKFGKDRVLQELDNKFIELFEIGYFELKGGMRIPLTGDYKEYEMYKELIEIIDNYNK